MKEAWDIDDTEMILIRSGKLNLQHVIGETRFAFTRLIVNARKTHADGCLW